MTLHAQALARIEEWITRCERYEKQAIQVLELNESYTDANKTAWQTLKAVLELCTVADFMENWEGSDYFIDKQDVAKLIIKGVLGE